MLSGALALALVLGFYFPWQNEFSQDTENGTGVKTLYAPVKKSASILFVGDIMMTRGVESSVNKNFAGDYSKIFEFAPYLADADITFGNLEGAVSDLGHNVGSKFSFRMNPLVIPALKSAGFDIVSFANNHVGDWTKLAFDDTRARLTEAGVLYTGAGDTKALAQTPTIIEKAGMKIGFLGFSDVGPIWLAAKEDSSGILLVNDDEFTESITNAKSLVDYLVVSIHWGEEYKTVHNAHQEAIAHKVIDAGADLLAGHHPHVAQDIEEYKNGLIIYSLGNYVFDQSFSTNTMKGLNVLVTVEEEVRKEYALYESHLNSKYQIESVTPLAP